MKISKFKLAISAIFGGTTGVVKYLLTVFNENVLDKIENKEEANKYLLDVQALVTFIRAILTNHEQSLSENRKAATMEILSALEDLASALSDFAIDTEELDEIVKHVKIAVQAFKNTK